MYPEHNRDIMKSAIKLILKISNASIVKFKQRIFASSFQDLAAFKNPVQTGFHTHTNTHTHFCSWNKTFKLRLLNAWYFLMIAFIVKRIIIYLTEGKKRGIYRKAANGLNKKVLSYRRQRLYLPDYKVLECFTRNSEVLFCNRN